MSKSKIIAFYLPQYHPIPENDKWWGTGFTDWINVAKARPRHRNHYQPHIPADLGFYDLRLEITRIEQANLAREYGIDAFCFYHYWFNGKLLLERPFNEILQSGKPDFPFCLCWANENWTKRWDGLDHEILMEQNYDDYDTVEHLNWLKHAFNDKRYLKVNERPVFLIYNPSSIPNCREKLSTFRMESRKLGIKDIYFCAVLSVHNKLSEVELVEIGFDAIVDFVPNMETYKKRKSLNFLKYLTLSLLNKIIEFVKLNKHFNTLQVTSIYDYARIARLKMNPQRERKIKKFPCVIPSWDNSARKRKSAVIFNDDPILYKQWLLHSIESVKHFPEEERLVFINAWNEWAEGCHLEPDIKYGKMFLEATRDAINQSKS